MNIFLKISRRSLVTVMAVASTLLLVLAANQAFASPTMTSSLSVSSVVAGNKVDLTTQIPGVSDIGTATQEIIQTIDPTKVKLTSASDVIAPEGWTVTYSTDGTTFSATPSSWAAVVKVKATGTVNSGGVTGDGKQLYQTSASAPGTVATPNGASRSGGDGWDVEFDSRGYIYNWYHHGALGSGLDCRDRYTGALCAGNWPMRLANSGFYSAFQSTLFYDEVNQHIWLPAADRSTGTGFLCVDVADVATPVLCGGSTGTAWKMLNARANAQETQIEQIIESEGKIYSWDILSGKILCYDYLANNGMGAACSNMPAITVTAGSANSLNSNPQNSMTYFREAFGNLYGQLNASVTCFNATTMEKCTGWANYSQTLTLGNGHAMYLQPNAAGEIIGVCTATNAKCFAADGTTFSTAPVVQTALNNGTMGRWMGSILTVGSKFLFNNIWDKPSYVFCYDFATSAACAGWGASSFNGVTGVGQISGSRIYAMDLDPLSSDCVWTNSDNGSPMITQITVSTGKFGCSIKLATSTFKQDAIDPRLTCDATSGLGYNRFTLSGLTKGTDYTSASLTITKANGEVLVSGGTTWGDVAFNSEDYVDLSSIVPSEIGQNASFKINYVNKTTTNAATGTLLMKSNSAQLCLSLTVNVICPATTLVGTPDTAYVSFDATGKTTNSLSEVTNFSVTSPSLTVAPAAASVCGFVLNAEVGRGQASQAFPASYIPVEGAVAYLTNTSGTVLNDVNGVPIQATSDAAGKLTFGVIKPGSYKVAFADFPLVNGLGTGDVVSTYISPYRFETGSIVRTSQNPSANFSTIQSPLATLTFNGTAGGTTVVKSLYIMRGAAVNDTASTSGGVAVTVSVLANDTAATTETITTNSLKICAANTTSACALNTLTVASQGTYTVSSGKIVFTPVASFSGVATITYGVNDGYSGNPQMTATLATTVIAAPAAVADTLTGHTLAPITVDVTANDTADQTTSLNKASVKLCAVGTTTGCALTSVTITGKGVYSVDNLGVVTFTPDAAVIGAIAGITYSVTDLLGSTAFSTVTATVTQTPPTITTAPFATATISVANSYTQTVVAGSGTIPATGAWRVLTGTLPTGMTLNTATGAITGTPTVAGTYTFTVQVTDSNAKTGTKVETILVAAPPVVTTTPITQKLYTGAEVTIPSTATQGTGAIPATGAWSATGLPAGITINPDTGAFSGTPTTPGTYTVVERVTDSNGLSATKTITMRVVTPPTISTAQPFTALTQGIVITSIPQTFTVGSATIAATGAWTISSGALPTGLAINANTGAITGTPTVAGIFTFTVKLTDTGSEFATKVEVLEVLAPPVITTTPTTPKLYTGVEANIPSTVTAGSGTIPATGAWSATGLPAGVSINPDTGVFTGTPTTAGTYTVVERVTDSNGLSATKTLTMKVVTPPTITTVQPFNVLARGKAITSIPQTFTVGSATIATSGAWAISSGAIPNGLTFNTATGAITGTPTVSGTYSFTVKLTDTGAEVSTKAEVLVVADAPTVTTTPLTRKIYTTEEASIPSTATLGSVSLPSDAWTATNLPAGLTIDPATGTISGIPTTTGTFAVVEKVTDINGLSDTETISIKVVARPIITTPLPLAALVQGTATPTIAQTRTAGSAAIAATGAWSIISGALPTGLTFNTATGAITGTPTTNGTFNFTVKLTDVDGEFTTKEESLVVAAPPTITTTPLTRKIYTTEEASIPSSATQGTVGFSPTDAWSATNLPAGLTIDPATGTISGIPTATGTFAVVERVTDLNGLSDTETISIKVVARPVITTPLPLAALVQGTAVTTIAQTKTAGSSAIAATGAWSIVSGSLPTGLTFNTATGAITGTPTANGTFNFTVKLIDVDGEFTTKEESLVVAAPPTITTTPTVYKIYVLENANILSSATQGTVGFSPTDAWSATGLPAGLTIDPVTGTISGIPTATGTFTVIERVTDLNGLSDTESLTIRVVAKPTITTPLPFAALVQGSAMTTIDQTKVVGSALIPATGAWTITTGALPQGVTLNANTGALTGTPTTIGIYTFTVKLTDADGEYGTKEETLIVAAPPTITTTPNTYKIYTGEGSSITSSATKGTADISATGAWSATGLPAGLSIDPNTGEISGTPTATGTFSVVETVTDLNGLTDTETLTVKVVTRPVITTVLPFTTLVTGVLAAPINQTKTAGSALIPATGAWSLASGSLPAGLTLNADTGAISGTPTEAGSFLFTIKLVDADGEFATKLEAIEVIAPPTITTTPTSYKIYVGEAASITSTVSKGSGDILSSGAWTATGLPSGLSINPTNGIISGTPSATGTFTVTEKVTDVNSLFDTEVLTIKVVRKPAITTTLPLAAIQKDVTAPTINQTKTAGSALIPATGAWSVSEGSLPDGLTMNPDTGAITGTPTASGQFTFTVKLVDVDGEFSTKVETITVNTPPVITTTPLTYKLYRGEAASLPSTATAGTGIIPSSGAWSATGMPSGLSISPSNGTISGTPSVNGTFQVTQKVTDVNSLFDTEVLTIKVVTRPVITTSTPLPSLGQGVVATPIAQTKTAGTALIGTTGAWSITAGALPAGLVLNADTGEITGTPTVAGVFEITVKLVDLDGEFATKVETITVNTPPTITTTPLTKTINVNVQGTIPNTVTEGTGAIPIINGWSATGLPEGMSINGSTGVISGAPTAVGSYPVTVMVTDVNGLSDTEVLTITVVNGPVITTTPVNYKFGVNNDLNFMADDFFAAQFPISKSRIIINTATPGSFPIKTTGGWSATGLPAGLVINADNGKISGTATTVGEYPVDVTVADTAGNTSSKVLNISIVQGPKNTTQRVWNYELDINKGIGTKPVSITQTYTLGSAPLSEGRPVPFLVQGEEPDVIPSVSIVDGSFQVLPYWGQSPGKEKAASYTLKTLIVDKNGAYDLATFTINIIKPGSNITALPLPVGITDGMKMTDSLYPLAGTSSKKLPVTYTSDTPKVCTVDSATKKLKMVNDGVCTITASSGTGALLSKASQSFTITKLPQTTSIVTPGTAIPGGLLIAPMPTDDPLGFKLHAAVTSGLPPVYETLDPNVCSVDANGIVTWDADLTALPRVESDFSCRVKVSHPGDLTYSAAPPQTITLVATHVEPPAPEGGIAKEPTQSASLAAKGGTTPMIGGNSFKVIVDDKKKTVTVQPVSKGRWIGPIYADIKISYTAKGATTQSVQMCKRNFFGIAVLDSKKAMVSPPLGGNPLVIPENAKYKKSVDTLIKKYQSMTQKFSTTKTVKGKKVTTPGYLDWKPLIGEVSCVLDSKAYAAWKSGVQIEATATVTRDRRWPTTYTKYKSYDWKKKSNNGIIYPTVVEWVVKIG